MHYYLVEFACFPHDEVKLYLLDEQKYDDWCNCEPQFGYKYFKLLWNGEIEKIITKDSKTHLFWDADLRLKKALWEKEQVKHLAYRKWQQAGCPSNKDKEFWLAAEKEVERSLRAKEVSDRSHSDLMLFAAAAVAGI